MALVGSINDHKKSVVVSNTSSRALVGDSGWVTHMTATFTSTEVGPVECHFAGVHADESGAVNTLGRFNLDSGTTSTECQVHKQGFDYNRSFGSQNAYGIFNDVAAGSHTVEFQVRNASASTTGTMCARNPGSHAADRVEIIYRG